MLRQLFAAVQLHYTRHCNPLGLNDTTSTRIATHEPGDLLLLHAFYAKLAAVYRYKFGANQLEFLWDGSDHESEYEKNWSAFFRQTIEAFCRNEVFLRAVLDITVFLPETGSTAAMGANRMNWFLSQTFALKFRKKAGICEAKVA